MNIEAENISLAVKRCTGAIAREYLSSIITVIIATFLPGKFERKWTRDKDIV